MKTKIKILTIIMMLALILSACGSNNGTKVPLPTQVVPTDNITIPDPDESSAEKSEYFFEYNDVAIYMDSKATPIFDALGEPMHYFESPSCAFLGIDRVYTYGGFEIYTYSDENDENEHIFTLIFMNDSVETNEGITLSSKLDDIISKYGDDYIQEGDKYTYSDKNTNLSFVLKDGEVVDVSYNLILN